MGTQAVRALQAALQHRPHKRSILVAQLGAGPQQVRQGLWRGRAVGGWQTSGMGSRFVLQPPHPKSGIRPATQ